MNDYAWLQFEGSFLFSAFDRRFEFGCQGCRVYSFASAGRNGNGQHKAVRLAWESPDGSLEAAGTRIRLSLKKFAGSLSLPELIRRSIRHSGKDGVHIGEEPQ